MANISNAPDPRAVGVQPSGIGGGGGGDGGDGGGFGGGGLSHSRLLGQIGM